MNQLQTTLERLHRLQGLEAAIASLDAALARIPGRIADIEATLQESEKALAAARAAVQEAARERRAFEQDIEAVRQKISRYQDQLMQVKTNEQYRALNQEIATERGRIEALEERILLNLERVDDLNGTIRLREGELGEERRRVETEKRERLAEQARDEADRARLAQERVELEAQIPPADLGLYRRIASTRGGVGLALVEGESCGVCRVRNRPQAIQEVRGFARLVQCTTCQRILYAPAPAGAPETDASGAAGG